MFVQPPFYGCMYCSRKFFSQISFIKHLDIHKNLLNISQRGRQSSNTNVCKKINRTNFLPIHRALFQKLALMVRENRITSRDGNAIAPPPILEPDPDPHELPLSYKITNTAVKQDFAVFIESSKLYIRTILLHTLDQYHKIRYKIAVHVAISSTEQKLFQSKYIALTSSLEIDDTIDILVEILPIDKHERVYIRVNALTLIIKKFSLVTGGYLPLPKQIYESVLILRNYDDYCFKWALLSAVAKQGDSSGSLLKQQYATKFHGDITSNHITFCGVDFDFSGLSFPLKVSGCGDFEEKNPHVSITVYGLQVNSPECAELYRTRKKQKLHINLLFLEDIKENKTHYAFIKYLPKILRARTRRSIRLMDFYDKFSENNEYRCKVCCEVLKTDGMAGDLWTHIAKGHPIMLTKMVNFDDKCERESG